MWKGAWSSKEVKSNDWICARVWGSDKARLVEVCPGELSPIAEVRPDIISNHAFEPIHSGATNRILGLPPPKLVE